jgi:Arc/MetJ family transcription regulator
MRRTTIEIDERLIRRARKLTGLKTRREIVARAQELLVRSETRKGVLAYHGCEVWKGDLMSARRNRV